MLLKLPPAVLRLMILYHIDIQKARYFFPIMSTACFIVRIRVQSIVGSHPMLFFFLDNLRKNRYNLKVITISNPKKKGNGGNSFVLFPPK